MHLAEPKLALASAHVSSHVGRADPPHRCIHILSTPQSRTARLHSSTARSGLALPFLPYVHAVLLCTGPLLAASKG